MTDGDRAEPFVWDPTKMAAYQQLHIGGEIFDCWITFEALCAVCGRLAEAQAFEAAKAHYETIVAEWRRRIRAGDFDRNHTVWVRQLSKQEATEEVGESRRRLQSRVRASAISARAARYVT